MDKILRINEIFKSIQGESTYVGLPCVFIRMTGCNLRCIYCDTAYAYEEGQDWTIDQILQYIKQFNCNIVEITGGEPLIQAETLPLIRELSDRGYKVLIETNGTRDISPIDQRATIIMDIKCPESGVSRENRWPNISHLKDTDEVKFVIGSRRDYTWALSKINRFSLDTRCTVLFSPAYGSLSPQVLAEWILKDNLNVRFQLQLHKYIWDPGKRGV
ncbi:MAG: 7-carboxy-7-deazaguanine synthase [Syntrophus sp. (in: bacteria)]|nr:7-carboxy-7-deazaguanine synthase [Syntrophus sp. (in: bacteria)]